MTAQQLRQPVQPSVDAAAINAGTKMYSHNGDQLGIVGDVWAYIPPYGYVAKSKFAVANYCLRSQGVFSLTGKSGGQAAPPSSRRRSATRPLGIWVCPLHAWGWLLSCERPLGMIINRPAARLRPE